MAKTNKLSLSKVSGNSFSTKSKPLPMKTIQTLADASKSASEKISHNNQIYAASNSHASYYATK